MKEPSPRRILRLFRDGLDTEEIVGLLCLDGARVASLLFRGRENERRRVKSRQYYAQHLRSERRAPWRA